MFDNSTIGSFSGLIYPLSFALLFAILSFLGVFLFRFNWLKSKTNYLISLAAGAMLADAFVHILPEVAEESGFGLTISLTFLSSILVSFLVESYFRWRECCEISQIEGQNPVENSQKVKALGFMNLFGDSWCNFNDGITLSVAFLASPATGFATGLAILLHEIPQEIADFGILVHSGFSYKKAMLANFMISLIGVLGVIFGYFVVINFPFLQSYFLAFGAGSITYLALSGLIPEVHNNHKKGFSWQSFLMLLIGIILISSIKLIEQH
jgi:zinc and cadmium transporter